jgi:NAD(P)-dependent dehydrogenase (short-subunit alcohol dehydrogenase family)
MTMRLTGKTAIVTGAGRGIGRDIAARLASEGAKVVVADVDEKAAEDALTELKDNGGTAVAVACDVTQQADVETMMQRCVDQWGRLDILVNNAGITRDAPLAKMTVEAWDLVLDVNLKGAFLCLQAAAKHMVAASYGRIVNISSIAHEGNFGTANYTASKGGINSLTKSACLELAQHKVTVNAVAPGAVATRLTLELPPKIQEKFLKKIPCHRWADPKEIAGVVAFLASDEASYINGQVIHVCGGLTVGYL